MSGAWIWPCRSHQPARSPVADVSVPLTFAGETDDQLATGLATVRRSGERGGLPAGADTRDGSSESATPVTRQSVPNCRVGGERVGGLHRPHTLRGILGVRAPDLEAR